MNTRTFSEEEFQGVVNHSVRLIDRGYITGFNLISSQEELPQAYILIHFLHDNRKHARFIGEMTGVEHDILRRRTFYLLSAEYVQKPNFEQEYEKATFYDSEGKAIDIKDIEPEKGQIIVQNEELDLLIPISEETGLARLVSDIKTADEEGPEPWIDPVIIICPSSITSIQGFSDMDYVSISRTNEEFYTLVSDKRRLNALKKYLKRVCKKNPVGKIKHSDVVIRASQINNEFVRYIQKMQAELRKI
ncbi:hypothetical protein KY349_03590 [Candidatus Woesearchaeota archaeon]|nr:hypothetical protein [Candidatus Woesearchaeota archaeon]